MSPAFSILDKKYEPHGVRKQDEVSSALKQTIGTFTAWLPQSVS